ncbi:hypothetical protein LTR16_008394, partial [Cryomyces antarcticus]
MRTRFWDLVRTALAPSALVAEATVLATIVALAHPSGPSLPWSSKSKREAAEQQCRRERLGFREAHPMPASATSPRSRVLDLQQLGRERRAVKRGRG